jgi:hypothetical protein
MSSPELAVAALVLAAVGCVGIGAITHGRTPLAGRRRIARPRRWGYGLLVSDAGLAGFIYFGPYPSPHSHPYLAVACMVVAFVGIFVQQAAARPAKPTKNAS